MMERSISILQKIYEEEVWRTYPEYDFVEVNQFGEVRTKDRTILRKNGAKQFIKGHILKQHPNEKGYMIVEFGVNGKNVILRVHRLVAICFIPNPLGLPEVNHIDNDRTNNYVNNLEWCDRQYNLDYKKKFGTSPAEVQGHPVIAVNTETGEVLRFESQGDSSRQICDYQLNIWKVVNNKRKTVKGFWFCNADNYAIEKARVKFGDEISKKVGELINDIHN